MIIAFAFGLIGALLVMANHKYLRIFRVSIVVFIATAGLAVMGIYFILNSSPKTDTNLVFPMFVPLTAMVIFHFTRLFYKKQEKKEIILHIHGLFPIRQDERYVTKFEIYITFILLVLSVVIPFIILKILL